MHEEIEFEDDPSALYRIYGENDELLYVGVTFSPAVRMAQHAVEQPWWPEVVRKTMAWYPTRAEAAAAETAAIRTECPKYNRCKVSTASSTIPGPRFDLEDLAARYGRGELVQIAPGRHTRKKTSILQGNSA